MKQTQGISVAFMATLEHRVQVVGYFHHPGQKWSSQLGCVNLQTLPSLCKEGKGSCILINSLKLQYILMQG